MRSPPPPPPPQQQQPLRPVTLAGVLAALIFVAGSTAAASSSAPWRSRVSRQTSAEGNGCVLPEQPANGQYLLGGCAPPQCRPRPGERVDLFALLNYTCAPGYFLVGEQVAYCDGNWSPSLPSCAPDNAAIFCLPLISSSHDIKCTLNNRPVRCDELASSDTKATVKCKAFYEPPPDKSNNYEITCDSRGSWSQPLSPCTPECGSFNFNISKETEDGVTNNIPWYAAILKKNAKGSWTFACSASIISPQVLVSVAQCVWKELDKKVADAENYGVVIGKFEHGPKEEITNAPQLILVDKIYVTDTFRGYERRYEDDISVFVLKNEITFNEVTHPICIDFDDKYAPYFIPGKEGIIGSWGEPVSETYKQQVISLPVVDFEECLKSIPTEFHSFLTYDKFCAGVLKKQSVCNGDSGVGYANKFKDGKWYLTGIASVGVSPTDGKSCEIDYYKGFTRVSLFINFIKKHINEKTNNTEVVKPPFITCKDNEFKCASSECVNRLLLCDGTKHCSDGSDETFEECHLMKCAATSFKCRYGACINKKFECNGKQECEDGSDEDPSLCKKTENPASCYSPGKYCKLPDQPENGYYTFVGCDFLPGNIVAPGILLNFSCKPGFVLSGPSLLACYDGWSSIPPSCNPVLCNPLQNPSREVHRCILNREDVDCTTKSVKPGTTATVRCQSNHESIPGLREYDLVCQADGNWNRELHSCVPKCGIPNPRGVLLIAFGQPSFVAQFPWHVGFYELDNGKMIPTCGGTIVSSHVVISAAHCFWRNNTLQFTQYRAVAGKYYYDWNNKIPYVQPLPIKTVILHSKFKGSARHYENDIAIIILKNRIVINEAVRPVCLDYEKNYLNYFTPGTVGNVSGWGQNEKESFSETLNVASLPYVSSSECEKHTPDEFHTLLTNDKFCAGSETRTSVCPGDSGGGYTVRFKDGRHYLTGVVSAGPVNVNCGQLKYVSFTNVYNHLELIKSYVYKYV